MVVKKCLTTAGYAVLAGLLWLFSFGIQAQTPTLSVEDEKVWVKGIEPEVLYTFSRYFNSQKDWEAVFPVKVKESTNGIVVNGTYEIFSDAICFTPRFPFAPRTAYKATFYSAELAKNTNEVYLPAMSEALIELEFSPGNTSEPPSSVVAVYPSADVVPENLLKFHIAFSKSMSVGEAYNRIKLLDSDGKAIEKAFLVLDQELWDAEMKTLTLLLDPGRIKRGLRPNVEMKPALQRGARYNLVIEKGWRDIDGNVTEKDFVKTFTCISADRTAPTITNFTMIAPQIETAPLIINLNEKMNYLLLQEAIRVIDSSGNMINGQIHARNHETVIEFVPNYPWSDAQYTIEFNPLLEDLAGNNFKRLFDLDLTTTKRHNQPVTTISLKIPKTAR